MEPSRKHGQFDPRYPPIRHKPSPASLWRLGEEHLDWQRFLARFFPATGRHDLDALAAYGSYMKDVEGRPARGPRAPGSSSNAVPDARSDTAQIGSSGRPLGSIHEPAG
jgi:hypothetical protein